MPDRMTTKPSPSGTISKIVGARAAKGKKREGRPRKPVVSVAPDAAPSELQRPAARLALPQPSRVRLTVVKLPPNTRLVLARTSDGEERRVWVGSNENFVVGDVIEAEPYPGVKDVWRITSQMPKSRRRTWRPGDVR